jgi:hypothetical protein
LKLARRVVLGGAAALPAAAAAGGPATVTRAYAPCRFGQIHYRRAGVGGTPLLAFHQVPNSGQIFAPLLPLLGRAAFAPDTPGYGMSDPAPDPQSIAAYADAMEDSAGALSVRGPFDLIGYHTGAAIACELANRGRLPVRRVMLISVPVFSPEERASFGAQTPIPFDEDGDWAREEWRRSWRWRGPGQDRASVLRSFAEKMRPGARERWRPGHRRLRHGRGAEGAARAADDRPRPRRSLGRDRPRPRAAARRRLCRASRSRPRPVRRCDRAGGGAGARVLRMIADAPIDDGFAEVVAIVSDASAGARAMARATGWTVRHSGAVDQAVLRAWGLPATARGREAVLSEPGARRGFVRLVSLSGAGEQRRMRSSAQPWEAGGWAGVNVRVADIDAAFTSLQRAGWQGFSDPVAFDVPPYRVREAMLVGPDGLVLGLLQRVSPPMQGWSQASAISRPVTMFATVRDGQRARAFLEAAGLKVRLDYDGPTAPPGPNLFALPHNVAPGLTRTVSWHQAAGRDEGTVAVIRFRGLEGRDHAASARAPNLGWLGARLFVSDPAARCAGRERWTARLAPWGRVTGCTLAMPDGGQLDLIGAAR